MICPGDDLLVEAKAEAKAEADATFAKFALERLASFVAAAEAAEALLAPKSLAASPLLCPSPDALPSSTPQASNDDVVERVERCTEQVLDVPAKTPPSTSHRNSPKGKHQKKFDLKQDEERKSPLSLDSSFDDGAHS